MVQLDDTCKQCGERLYSCEMQRGLCGKCVEANKESLVEFESLYAIYKVTEMREGAVYKTEFVGYEWAPLGMLNKTVDGKTYYSPPTSYAGLTIRHKKGDT